MRDSEQPGYQVLSSFGHMEIRQYAPMMIAEVAVRGERKKAMKDGFRLLADYIFGNNTMQSAIAMTVPVQQQVNQKIAMTAPVQQQSSGNLWKVSFFIPAEYRLETVPKPNDPSIKLRSLPAKRVIVIQFSGYHSDSTIAKYEKQLVRYMKENQMQALGAPKYAFYNPPWTLPFLRRNEIMLEIDRKV